MSLKDKLFDSAVFRIIGQIITIGIALVVTPFLIRNLGEEGYGLWLLIVAVLGWFRFVDFGFSAAVQRSIAIAVENDDQHAINTVFSVSVILFSALGLVAAAMVFCLSFFPELLGVQEGYFEVVNVALMILSLKLVWDIGMCSFHGFYSGFIRYDVDANINSANEIIKAILILVLVTDFNIYGAVIATMVSDLLTNVFKIFYAYRIFPEFKFDLKLINREEFRNLFNYSKHTFALSITHSFSNGVDSLIISHLLGLTYVAIYGVGKRLVDLVEQSFLTVLGIFLPVLTRLIQKREDVSTEMNQIFMLNFFLVSVCFIPLIILTDSFLLLWLGSGFEEAWLIVTGLAVAYMCRAISRPVMTLLLAQANHSKLSPVRVAQIVINIVLSVILGAAYGMPGILIATIFSFYVCDVAIILVLYRAYTDYPIFGVVARFVLANILLAVFSALGLEVVAYLGPLSWLGLVASASLFFLLSVAVCWVLLLDNSTRSAALSIVKNKLPAR